MTGTKIIVVEDERIVALHLQQQLTKLGYEVAAVIASGEKALQKVTDLRPDLILMDIHIEGDIDGIETVRRIPADLYIPVIYVTAYSEQATLDRARATKPYGFLVKPFSERELHATIQMALERHRTDLDLRSLRRGLQETNERLQAEIAERTRSEHLLEASFAAAPFAMLVTAPDEKVMVWNKAAETIFGYTAREMIGESFRKLVPQDEQEYASQLIKETAGRPVGVRTQIVNRDGKRLDVDVSIAPVYVSDGGLPGRVTMIADVTEKIRTEAQLRQAQKMEAIGQLTGGIAHDFNNLLAVIHGNLELIKEWGADNPEVDEMAGDALRAAARGAGLTHQLLAYSRQQPLMPQVVPIEDMVSSVTKLLRRTLGDSVEIRTVTQPGLWPTTIDPNQLENALLNLAVNARDAMPDGGKLTIECSNTYLDENYSEINADVAPGPYVLVAVTDTGTGMSKEIAEKVIEPFFTTKPAGKGTGLGLSMVYGFIKQSGGHLKIYSEVGCGTTVNLYLPKARTAVDDGKGEIGKGDAPRSREGEVVLVVEDEDMVRKFATRVLMGLGYRVLQAADGPEALRMLEAAGRIDLLLTDVSLPKGMNGPAIAREARLQRPDLRILYMSGYATDAVVNNGILEAGSHLLSKPFPKGELARKIRGILDEEAKP